MFAIWGGVVLDVSLDTVVWNAIFFGINVYHCIILLKKMYPVRFDKDREAIYQHFFVPGKYFLTRSDFKLLVQETTPTTTPTASSTSSIVSKDGTGNSTIELTSPIGNELQSLDASPTNVVTSVVPQPLCQIRSYRCGSYISQVGDSIESLRLILRGHVVVEKLRPGNWNHSQTEGWMSLNHLKEFDFLDSPEWIGKRMTMSSTKTTNETGQSNDPPKQVFEVRIRVLSEQVDLFEWNLKRLDDVLKVSPTIESALNGIVGIDLARKIFTGNMERFTAAKNEDGVAPSTTMMTMTMPPVENTDTDENRLRRMFATLKPTGSMMMLTTPTTDGVNNDDNTNPLSSSSLMIPSPSGHGAINTFPTQASTLHEHSSVMIHGVDDE